jgi:hypothetical protein
MKSWFIFAHITDKDEDEEFYNNFKKCRKNLDTNTSVYILKIYSKRLANIIYMTSDEEILLKKSQQKSYSRKSWLENLVDLIKLDSIDRKTDIKAISYYGHGGSVVVGPWDDPFLGVSELLEYIAKPFNIKLIAYDACYMGGVTSIYETSHYSKFAVASPSWHPDLSVSILKNFGTLPNVNDDKTWKNYTKNLACEFKRTNKYKPKYSCLVPLDLRKFKNIVKKIKVLKLTSDTVLKLSDPQQFDLFLSITDQKIAKDIQKTVISNFCINECPERIHGISIREPDPKDPWHKFFVKTKWSKILNNIEIISDKEIKLKQIKEKSKRKNLYSKDC